MTNTNNDVTGDRITNALKGDKEAYRNNWERIFGKPSPAIEKIREKNMERYEGAYRKLAEDDGDNDDRY